MTQHLIIIITKTFTHITHTYSDYAYTIVNTTVKTFFSKIDAIGYFLYLDWALAFCRCTSLISYHKEINKYSTLIKKLLVRLLKIVFYKNSYNFASESFRFSNRYLLIHVSVDLQEVPNLLHNVLSFILCIG